MKDHHCKAYLVNTGWNGTGKRISIKETRAIIDAILSGDIEKAPTKHIPILNLTIPTELPGVNSGILDPRDTYSNVEEWSKKAQSLANKYADNFVQYATTPEAEALIEFGPQREKK